MWLSPDQSLPLYCCIRVLQRNRTNRICLCIYKEMYYKELAHMIMEAEKSHDLLSVSWRPRRAAGVVPV